MLGANYPCPGCGAASKSTTPEYAATGVQIGVTIKYECGSWDAESEQGFKTRHRSPECERKYLTNALVDKTTELESVRQEWAKDKLATGEKLRAALLRLDELQARVTELQRSRDVEVSSLNDTWEAEKRRLQVKLTQAKKDREKAEESAAHWKMNAEQYKQEAAKARANEKQALNAAHASKLNAEEWRRLAQEDRGRRFVPGPSAGSVTVSAVAPFEEGDAEPQVTVSGKTLRLPLGSKVSLDDETREWLRREFAKVRPMTAEERAESAEVAAMFRANRDKLGDGPGIRVDVNPESIPAGGIIGQVPSDRAAWRTVRIVPLDAGVDAGQQSPESLATQTPESPMSPQQVIAQAIGLLKLIAWLTPIQIDDAAARFLEANQNAAWLIALVGRIVPATDNESLERASLHYEPEMVEALALFDKNEGRPPLAGGGKLLTLILQIIALVKAGKGNVPAVPAGT
jgi:hypothetical protein